MRDLAKKSKIASKTLRLLDHPTRKKLLISMADELLKNTDNIIKANALDLEIAKKNNLNSALIDRLKLDTQRINSMISGVESIAEQKEVVGAIINEFKQDNGLVVKKQRIPLGVILMVFESRPNVVVDCAALAIKSSNSIILKGGKEAKHSNEILGKIIQETICRFIPKESIQVLASDSRETINELLTLEQYIDVVIPRGGEKLIQHVYENAKMPVIAHFKGLCHMYLDKSADLHKATHLVLNAKTQRPGVCNSIETLLIHEELLPMIAEKVTAELLEKKTELRVDKRFANHITPQLKASQDSDWSTEYLENVLSIKTVSSIDEAIAHIDKYGTQHTECIVSEDPISCDLFLNSVDASCITVNASTRFNDGGQLGLGAELGISTTKLHAYGPMGAEQMTTSRFLVIGDGHRRT